MNAKKLEELETWQLALEFKLATYELVKSHRDAYNDLKFRSQLYRAVSDAEADVAEGFARFRAGEFVQFLSYARASNCEAQRRLKDGVHRGYYTQEAADPVLTLGRRDGAAIAALQKSLEPFIRGRRKLNRRTLGPQDPEASDRRETLGP